MTGTVNYYRPLRTAILLTKPRPWSLDLIGCRTWLADFARVVMAARAARAGQDDEASRLVEPLAAKYGVAQ